MAPNDNRSLQNAESPRCELQEARGVREEGGGGGGGGGGTGAERVLQHSRPRRGDGSIISLADHEANLPLLLTCA